MQKLLNNLFEDFKDMFQPEDFVTYIEKAGINMPWREADDEPWGHWVAAFGKKFLPENVIKIQFEVDNPPEHPMNKFLLSLPFTNKNIMNPKGGGVKEFNGSNLIYLMNGWQTRIYLGKDDRDKFVQMYKEFQKENIMENNDNSFAIISHDSWGYITVLDSKGKRRKYSGASPFFIEKLQRLKKQKRYGEGWQMIRNLDRVE